MRSFAAVARRQMAALGVAVGLATAAAPEEASPERLLAAYCAPCHSGAAPAGGVELNRASLRSDGVVDPILQERVWTALDHGRMPPSGAATPSRAERRRILNRLENDLLRRSRDGARVPRRLNRREYENTIRALFDLPAFRLPDGFPQDDSRAGFDNVGEGLILSPPLMAQLLSAATAVADELLGPDPGLEPAQSRPYPLGTGGLSMEGGGPAAGGSFRLMSSRNMASAAAWPARFEAPRSGIYRIRLSARAYQTDRMSYPRRTEPFRIAIYARPKTEQVYAPFEELRKVTELHVDAEAASPQALIAEVELLRGDVFGVRWEDGPAYSDPLRRDYSHQFLADRLKADRRYYAAMLQFGGGSRGTTQAQLYDATRALMESGDLDLSDPRLDSMPEAWGGGLSDAPHNWIKAFVHEELYRHGPAVDLTVLEVEGPLRLVEDDEMRERRARSQGFLGQRPPGATDEEHVRLVLERFLPSALRRPATDDELRTYAELATGVLASDAGTSVKDGLHLAVRRVLVSPSFLYRGLQPGRLDDYGIAARLSYFLTSGPPDDRLATLARTGALSEPSALADEAERLIRDPRSDEFVRSFTGQWLATRVLRSIMPDPRLLAFGAGDQEAMIAEAEMLFAEILRSNLPVEAFIDPGFSYRNARLNKIYGGRLQDSRMQRVPVQRDGRFGGVLGMAAVMMATANGVDTNPVLRGAWVLENVFGEDPGEPPGDVPAIAPDTTGARTIREQLAAHRADPSCAKCHDRMDPLGAVLESFDPVGRWRSHYPKFTAPRDGERPLEQEFYSTVGQGTVTGPAVDSAAVLPDGTRLESVIDLKRYLLRRVDVFARCLAEKLLVYATGRPLTFRDRLEARRIARSAVDGGGFRDLVVGIAQSPAFAVR